MGRQPGRDDDWELSDDDLLAEVSPARAYQSNLFQRINRQRAAYFADVEDESGEDQDPEDLFDEDRMSQPGQAADPTDGGKRLSPSGFADLSTWCCDALVPARSRLMTLEKQPAGVVSLAEQPTIVLPVLPPVAPAAHIADMPTAPILFAINVQDVQPESRPFSGEKRDRGGFWRFWRYFPGRWPLRIRQRIRLSHTRRPALEGHALLMARMREREKRRGQSVLPPRPPGDRRMRQFR